MHEKKQAKIKLSSQFELEDLSTHELEKVH